MGDEYYEYPDDEDLPLLDSREDAMSSSSDSDRSQDFSRMNLSGKPVRRKWIELFDTDDLDPGLRDLISTIIETVTVERGQLKIYPPSFHAELQRKKDDLINSIKKLNYEHCFAIGGNTLASTLNIANNLISVPKGIRCDICIISNKNPVIILTFVEDEYNIAKKERYNQLLTRELTDILRTYMDETISVARGVVVKGSDLKSKIKTIQDDVKSSFFASMDRTLSFEDGTLQSAITAILIGISRAPSYQFIENCPGVIWTLSAEEVEKVLEHVDDREGNSYTSTLEDPGQILEIASRRSRRRRVRLDLTKQQYSRINISELRRWYPNLEVTANAESKGVTINGKVVSVREDSTVGTEESKPPHRSKCAIKRRKTWREKKFGRRTQISSIEVKDLHQQRIQNNHEQPTNNNVTGMKDLWTPLCDFWLIYCVIVLGFLLIYRPSIDARYHYFMKCLPLFFVITVIGKVYRDGSTLKKGMLLFGLVCSCVGDALFVWKPDYFELGLTFFSLAHISYGLGFKDARFERLLFDLMLALTGLFYLTWKLHEIFWCVLLLHVTAFYITTLRVTRTLHFSRYFELPVGVLFLFSNAFILVYSSEIHSPFPNKITTVLYYTTQLGMVMSILKNFRDEITSRKSKLEEVMSYIMIILLFFFGIFTLGYSNKTLFLNTDPIRERNKSDERIREQDLHEHGISDQRMSTDQMMRSSLQEPHELGISDQIMSTDQIMISSLREPYEHGISDDDIRDDDISDDDIRDAYGHAPLIQRESHKCVRPIAIH